MLIVLLKINLKSMHGLIFVGRRVVRMRMFIIGIFFSRLKFRELILSWGRGFQYGNLLRDTWSEFSPGFA